MKKAGSSATSLDTSFRVTCYDFDTFPARVPGVAIAYEVPYRTTTGEDQRISVEGVVTADANGEAVFSATAPGSGWSVGAALLKGTKDGYQDAAAQTTWLGTPPNEIGDARLVMVKTPTPLPPPTPVDDGHGGGDTHGD